MGFSNPWQGSVQDEAILQTRNVDQVMFKCWANMETTLGQRLVFAG